MKFNKTLNASILKEWRFYSVDYKAMKKALKNDGTNSSNTNVTTSSKKEFLHHYELSKSKLTKFYSDKDTWATAYYETMEDRVDILRSTKFYCV